VAVIVQHGRSEAVRERRMRKPRHPFYLHTLPLGIYPAAIAPVMPGESLKGMSLKYREVSHPIKNPHIGAWSEFFLFYVKLTDIDPDMGRLFTDPNYDSTAFDASADRPAYYTVSGQKDWVYLATEACVLEYFRDEQGLGLGETASSLKLSNDIHLAYLNQTSWMESAVFTADLPTPPDAGAGTATIDDDYRALQAHWMSRQIRMAEMGYPDYLRSFGVRAQRPRENVPELLHYSRVFSQPVNHVEPTDGAPSSAWWFDHDIKSSKSAYFREPGFLLVLHVVRPKMYRRSQKAAAVGELRGFEEWFPPWTLDDPTAGLRRVEAHDPLFGGDGVSAGGIEQPFFYDGRDLLTHGDQFVNVANLTTAVPPISSFAALAAPDNQEVLQQEVANEAFVKALFVTAEREYLYGDGLVSFDLTGHFRDDT